jgi:two-component sensor histidine kinase
MDAAVPIVDSPQLARTLPRHETLRLALCALLVALGAAVITGWFIGNEPLKSVFPGLSTMKFNTALGFVLVGAGLAAAAYPSLVLRCTAIISGGLAALIGVLTLIEYAAGANIGIDEAFVRDQGLLSGSGFPGRMSPLTATAWAALGAAIILMAAGTQRRHIVIAHLLASYAAVVAVLAAAAYTFGAEAFWGIGFYTAIAVHTGVGLLVAAAAALMTRAQEGWLEPYIGSPAARDLLMRLLPLSLLVPLCLGLLLMLGAGIGAFNAPYAFALFIPSATLAMVLIALWVAGKQREAELVQRRYERHLQLVVGELNHRVKNTLSIVQSLAHQSWKDPPSSEAAKEAFEGRLSALATAHAMLTRQNWEQVSLGEVVAAALNPHALCGKRILIDGPPVMLSPTACVTLAMTLHELATNAIKYGAMSVPGGCVDVSWSCDDGRLGLTWREREGPPCEPPAREGFGTRMLKRALASELGGKASLHFDPEGLTFEFEAPLPN